MKLHEISKLSNDSAFVTGKWIEVNDLSGGRYSVNRNIKIKTPTLRSNLCDHSNGYIVVKRLIAVEDTTNANKRNKMLAFKYSAPFRLYISKINNTFKENAEDLDVVMPMFNSLEYSENNFMRSGSLWNYYRKVVNNDTNEQNADDYRVGNSLAVTRKSIEWKIRIIRSASANNYFCRSFVLPLIKSEIELALLWSKDCVIFEIPEIAANPDTNPPIAVRPATQTTGTAFQINSTNCYAPCSHFVYKTITLLFRKSDARI